MNIKNTNVITNLLAKAITNAEIFLALSLKIEIQSKFFTVSGGTLKTSIKCVIPSINLSEYSA